MARAWQCLQMRVLCRQISVWLNNKKWNEKTLSRSLWHAIKLHLFSLKATLSTCLYCLLWREAKMGESRWLLQKMVFWIITCVHSTIYAMHLYLELFSHLCHQALFYSSTLCFELMNLNYNLHKNESIFCFSSFIVRLYIFFLREGSKLWGFCPCCGCCFL